MADHAPPFSITVHSDTSPPLVVAVTGEIDAASVDQLDILVDRLPAGEHVVFDLRDVSFMDSSGLRNIIRADTKLTLIVYPSEIVKRVLEIAGVDEAIDVRYP